MSTEPSFPDGSVAASNAPSATRAIQEPNIQRPCPICGTDESSRLFAEANFNLAQLNDFAFASRKFPEHMRLRLHECRRCDALYASPVFAAGTLAAAYRDAAYDSGAVAQLAAQTYVRYLPGLIARLPSLEGALDIGAGDGAFVRQLVQYGFTNVTGVEPSIAAVAMAPPEIRQLIRTVLFDPGDFVADSLSLVTCFQTIEHVDRPLRLCQAAFHLLRPGGALFVIGHNRRSLSARVLGRWSPIFDIEHLQLFSPRSLSNLLEAAGYRDVRVTTVVNRYPLSYWARLFPMPARIKSGLIRLLERTGIGNLKLSLPAGNIAAVGYKP
jgi:SAM-dependent methyltransferase